jgi:[acyl-carrier-protein] S-malonyltransferase
LDWAVTPPPESKIQNRKSEMNKVAFLFPGQGSQGVGMGMALAERYPEAAALFEQAAGIVGWDLLEACRAGPEERLRQTEIAQPTLYVSGCAAAAVLRSCGIQPEGVAGHSIGEYAALAVAGVFSFDDGLKLVQVRGRLMQEAAQVHHGSMAAILGLDGAQVKVLCQKAQAKGICVAVNFNSPEQTVIAGEWAGVEEAGRLAQAAGAKRVIALNVSGGFHSPLMAEAAQRMRQTLGEIAFQRASVPVAMNADGQLHQEADDIRTQLEQQLDHPVQWVRSILSLKETGYSFFVESGAGRVLTGLMRRIDPQLEAFPTDTVEAFEHVREAWSASRKGSS